MKALCVKQPWTSMIAWGEKTIETRTWYTKYRGSLLIVASKTPDKGFCCNGLPLGKAVAVAQLIDCRPARGSDEAAACCGTPPYLFSWVLQNIKPVDPFPVKGRLGLFNVEVEGKIKEVV